MAQLVTPESPRDATIQSDGKSIALAPQIDLLRTRWPEGNRERPKLRRAGHAPRLTAIRANIEVTVRQCKEPAIIDLAKYRDMS
jgi:hypothetical protein